jgi:thiol:disulfide interchange protein
MTTHTCPRSFRTLLVIALAFAGASLAHTAESGIQFFNGTFKEALAAAKAQKKPLFFDAYASWCGPCKTMEREVYTDPKVAAYFNEKFISIKVDMEKGEGPELPRSSSRSTAIPR